MNKDQKLIAEAYDEIQFTRSFKEMPGRLNPTADLEKIADFLNSNKVFSGAPLEGDGGWYVQDNAVYNDDTEGGFYLSAKIVPEKRGLIISYDRDGEVYKTLYKWPVEAKNIDQQMSRISAN